MKLLLIPVLLCAAVFVAPMQPVRVQAAAIEAAPSTVTTEDLAWALDMRWWSYSVTLPAPASGVFVRPCELRRQQDGSWGRTYLAPSVGFRTSVEPRFGAFEVKLVIRQDEPDVYGLLFKNWFRRETFDTRPNFADTYSPVNVAMIVDGCLALAIDEDIPGYPNTTTGREEDMVRVIALEIKTE